MCLWNGRPLAEELIDRSESILLRIRKGVGILGWLGTLASARDGSERVRR